jgi:hypothetical protein
VRGGPPPEVGKHAVPLKSDKAPSEEHAFPAHEVRGESTGSDLVVLRRRRRCIQRPDGAIRRSIADGAAAGVCLSVRSWQGQHAHPDVCGQVGVQIVVGCAEIHGVGL